MSLFLGSSRSTITAVWAVLVEAVLAVVGDAPAWAPAEPAPSCDAPSPQRSAAMLGPSFNDLIGAQQAMPTLGMRAAFPSPRHR